MYVIYLEYKNNYLLHKCLISDTNLYLERLIYSYMLIHNKILRWM